VWDEIGPRTDEHSRQRVKEAVADAVLKGFEGHPADPKRCLPMRSPNGATPSPNLTV